MLTLILNAGDIPIAIEFKSNIPIELEGNEGVMNLVSSGHEENECPTELRSKIRKFSIPECKMVIPTLFRSACSDNDYII